MQNGTNSDDDAQTVPYEQYQELELSSLAEINQLKHQISELENNVLSLSNDKEDSIPLSEYEDLLQGSEMQITQLKEEIMNLQAEIRGYQDKQIRGYQDKPEEDELRELRKEVETLRKQASEPSPQSVLNMKQLEESKDQDIVELSTQLDKLQRQLAEQEEMIPLKSYEEMKMVKEEEIKVLKTHVSVVEADVEKLKQEVRYGRISFKYIIMFKSNINMIYFLMEICAHVLKKCCGSVLTIFSLLTAYIFG